jgi:hypothetical protein
VTPHGTTWTGPVDAEVLNDLGGDEMRAHVDVGAAAQGAPDETGIAEGGGRTQLGVPHRRQVVHRDEARRPARRWHHEVGPVHHVDRAGPPLQGRDVDAGPEALHDGGGHGAASAPHPGREACRQVPPTPGRLPVADEVEIGSRQSIEEAPHRDAHPGRVAEEGGGVEGDGQHATGDPTDAPDRPPTGPHLPEPGGRTGSVPA